MDHSPTRAADISARLVLRIEALAVALTGNQPTTSTRERLRFGSKGSLSIATSGRHCGRFTDFQSGTSGGPIDLIMHFRQCSFLDALGWASAWLGDRGEAPAPRPVPAPRQATVTDISKGMDLALEVWRQSVDPAGTLAETYLAHRGLRLPTHDVLRFAENCPDGTDRRLAMVALMVDPVTNQPCGVHRTFLGLDGRKAETPVPKKMLGRAGIIALTPAYEIGAGLGICEGIETGLAVIQRADLDFVWACGSAGMIGNFPLIAAIGTLWIFADADDAGRKAAQRCTERWIAGRRDVRVETPPDGMDWHDALVRGKAA